MQNHTILTSPRTATASNAARMVREGAGDLRALRARLADAWTVRPAPTRRHVTTLDDVTAGLGLTPAQDARVKTVVGDMMPTYLQGGGHRSPMHAGALLRVLRTDAEIPIGARQEISTRAAAYWRTKTTTDAANPGRVAKAHAMVSSVSTTDLRTAAADWEWLLLAKSDAEASLLLEYLVKAKYIRRIATGNPKRPWRYIYHADERKRWQASAWETVKTALQEDQKEHGKPNSHSDGSRAVHFGENVAKLPVGVLKLALAHLEATHGKRAVAGLKAIIDHAEEKKPTADQPRPASAPEPSPPVELTQREKAARNTALRQLAPGSKVSVEGQVLTVRASKRMWNGEQAIRADNADGSPVYIVLPEVGGNADPTVRGARPGEKPRSISIADISSAADADAGQSTPHARAIETARAAIAQDSAVVSVERRVRDGHDRLYVDVEKKNGGHDWNAGKGNTGLYIDLKTGDVVEGDWAGAATRNNADSAMAAIERAAALIRNALPGRVSKALYIGPQGGKYADAAHTIPWTPEHGGQIGIAFPKTCSQCKGKGTLKVEQPDLFGNDFGGKTKYTEVKCRRCKGTGLADKAKKSADVVSTTNPLVVVGDWSWAVLVKSASDAVALLESLVKAKYIRRISTGNPDRPYRYIYHRQEQNRWERAAWDKVKEALRADQEEHGKSLAAPDGSRAVHFGKNVSTLNPQVLRLALAHLEKTHGKRVVAQMRAIVDHAEGEARHPDAPPVPTAKKDPEKTSAPSSAASRAGADTLVFVAGEGGQPQAMKAKYKLVEASEVKASHNPQTFAKNPDYPDDVQERAYHRDQDEQAKVIRNAQLIRPEFVVNTNPDAVNGPPIVSSDGVVLGGNSRTMSMQLAYAAHPEKAAEMKSYLADHAHSMGFDRQAVEGMKNPILVRVVEGAGDHEAKRLLVRQFNESFTQGMDPRTMQVALGRRVTPRTLDALSEHMHEDETLSAFLSSSRSEAFINGLRRDGVIDRRNANQYMRRDDGNKLNEDGKTLVSRILVGKILNNADILSHTSPRTLDSVARSVPHIMQAKAYGEGFDIAPALKVAVDALNDLQTKAEKGIIPTLDPKMSEREMSGLVEHFRLLPGMGNEHEITTNETARDLLEVLIRKPGAAQMSNVFREYAAAAAANPEGQGGLFGDAPTPQEILRTTIKNVARKAEEFVQVSAVRARADELVKAIMERRG